MRVLLEAVDAGRTVLAPTAEIASAVIERIEARFAATGRSVWLTPQIRDFSGWVRQLHQRQNFDAAAAPRLLSDVEERQLWREVIARSDIAADFSDPGGAARAARRAARALREHLIPAAALSAYQSAESNALAVWLADFEARCRALNALSGDRVLETLRPPAEMPLWLESPAWHPQARRWLGEHAGEPLSPPTGGVDSAGASVAIEVRHSAAAEMAACAAWAAEQWRRDGTFRAWICIPDLPDRRVQVAAAFDAALAVRRYGLQEYLETPAYALAGGVPLAGLEPVRIALESLSAACDRLSFARFSALLRAPALQGSDADGLAAARLDELLRSRAPHEARLPAWLELSERLAAAKSLAPVTALTRLKALDGALDRARSALRLSEWVPIWILALDAGPWAGRAQWSSAAYQAAERFRELQGALACADQVYGPLSKSAAIHALATAANEIAFQPQTGLAPIWVTSQTSDPWLDFDGIWVMGMGADQWPPAAAPLPLIPVQLQREFGVAGSTAALQLQRSLDLQRRWLQRCGVAVFSCSSETGMPAVPSALLAPLQRAAVDAGDVAAAPADPLLQRLLALTPPLEAFTDDIGPAFCEDEVTRGTFSLREQSQCPFRGFAATRLRADRLQLPTPGFNEMERGILLHKALELIWTDLRGSVRLAAIDAVELTALIERSVAQALREAVARRDPGAAWSGREARRLKRLLPLWLRIEADREPFEIAALEAERRGIEFGGLAFDVRIDRIDRLQDGGLVLLDYKSGNVRPDWEGDRPDNPQLPVYALSAQGPVIAVAYAQVQASACKFAGVSDREGALPRVRARKGEAAQGMTLALEAWSRRIELIAAELRSGVAGVAPTPAACRQCHLQGFCRISALAVQTADAAAEAADAQ